MTARDTQRRFWGLREGAKNARTLLVAGHRTNGRTCAAGAAAAAEAAKAAATKHRDKVNTHARDNAQWRIRPPKQSAHMAVAKISA